MTDKLSVSDVVFKLKNLVESEFRFLSVQGEVTQISKSHSGHFYFNLSDERSSMSCALFKMDARFNPIVSELKEGDIIEIDGGVSLYPNRASLQIIVKKIKKQDKKGALAQRFELLKNKLLNEGIFDDSHKVEIPKNPKKISIITSATGAAFGDFLKIMNDNCFEYQIQLIGCLVQGDKAPTSLIKAIDKAEHESGCEVIVLTRGGGSIEDLWCFNDESLARRIFDCKIPIISAVGHEMNNSISDFVSDLRCSTPSDAAKALSVYQREQKLRYQSMRQKMRNYETALNEKIQLYKKSSSPKLFLSQILQKIKIYSLRLDQFSSKDHFSALGIYDYQRDFDLIQNKLQHSKEDLLTMPLKRLSKVEVLQGSLNPYSVLGRGYTYIKSGDKVLESKNDFINHQDKDATIVFHDGEVILNEMDINK